MTETNHHVTISILVDELSNLLLVQTAQVPRPILRHQIQPIQVHLKTKYLYILKLINVINLVCCKQKYALNALQMLEQF